MLRLVTIGIEMSVAAAFEIAANVNAGRFENCSILTPRVTN